MARRDYASGSKLRTNNKRRSTQTRSSYLAPKASANPFKWLFFGLVLGLLAAYLVYLYSHSTGLQQEVAKWIQHNSRQPVAKAKPVSAPKENTSTTPKPTFSFYHVLSGDEKSPLVSSTPKNPAVTKEAIKVRTNIPNEAMKAAPSTSPAVHISIPPSVTNKSSSQQTAYRYWAQIASFKKAQEAEHLRALLTLKGFSVSVTNKKIHGDTWFRVFLGPYPSAAQAVQEKKRLVADHILS